MIPLADASRRLRSFPIATLLIIALNAIMFLQELKLGDPFVLRWALIPAHVAAGRDLITVFSAMFMHAGWLHILSNMLFLWVFGPVLEDVMGPVSYLIFYLLSGIAATVAQVLVMPASTVPNLGASGAIAGVMGGFLITYPSDRIRTLLIIFIFVDITLIPSILLIGIWFLTQLLNGIGSVADVQRGGVAYMAHVGGFIFGLVFARVFESARLRARQGLA
jgi:membrane associated rhomboid family serine protease